MFPQALQMTREECRGILRRLELESYSHVISVFRAQGGLSENKAKMLEELRTIFHISQERHRAEARRVANDEQLSTIAEAISGPNTWQEWSREGRRSFPMLPRIAPQTALALIANNVASEIANENSKCPYPADTAGPVVEEQSVNAAMRNTAPSAWAEGDRNGSYIVTSDPFKMPDIPSGPKKNLKRNMPDNHTGSIKKRLINEISPTKQQQQQKQYQHITANSPNAALNSSTSNIRKLYHNHSKLQQQRYFHQQQTQKQKTSTKKSNQTSPLTTTTNKRQATPAKSGRRAQQKLLQEQQKQQQQQQQEQVQQQVQSSQSRNSVYPSNSTSNISDFQHAGLVDDVKDQSHYIAMPQIAASKKDITKNLTKLQIPSATITPTSASAASTAVRNHDQHTLTATSPTNATNIASMLHGKMEKQLISTPVQKIILEDRQPPAPATPSSSSLSSSQHVSLSSSPQIMTLPQITAAATKLRAINTTILPPGTKLTKKLPASTILTATSGGSALIDHSASTNNSITSQPQVFSIIEGTTINTNAGGTVIAQSPLAAPTHTPPAIIQLHSSSGINNSSEISQMVPPTQGKVLTTKLLPIVLSGTGSGNVTTTANITKIEALNNNIGTTNTIVAAGTGATASTTMIKNIPSTMLQIGGGGVSGMTTLGSGAALFRKTPNIIKTGGFIGMGGTGGVVGGGATATKISQISSNFSTNTANSGGPQILSNVKLSSAISTTSSATQQQFIQHQLKNVSTTGIRTSVKICQSPNGKVFIQPANVDAATKAKLQSGLQHKLLSSTLIGSAGGGGAACGAGATSSTPQRIAIQKVQIIPAPLSSPGGFTGTLQTFQQQHQQQQKSTTLTTLGNKSNMNMIFMPATSARSTTGTITLAAKGNVAAVGTVGSVTNVIASKSQSPQTVDAIKPNVVVIGAATTMPIMPTKHQQQTSALKTRTSSVSNICSSANPSPSTIQFDSNQMITEDTPVDILNMPIIVDNSESDLADSVGASDTVTVLSSALIEAQSQHQDHPPHSAVILGATDWEMELDQATAVAAATKARSEYHRSDSVVCSDGATAVGRQNNSLGEHQQQNLPTDNSIAPIIIDDSFEDVIVEEQEDEQEAMGADTTEEDMDENIAEDCELSNAPNDDIIILSDEKAKVVDLKATHQHNEADDEQIEVVDEEQQKPNKKTEAVNAPQSNVQAHATECEMNAGFDESIVTEIDENTAIEYIEEDQSDAMALEIKGNTEINLPTQIVEANSADGKSTSTTAVQDKNLKAEANYDDFNCHVNEEISAAAKDILSFVAANELEASPVAAPILATSVDDNISLQEEQ